MKRTSSAWIVLFGLLANSGYVTASVIKEVKSHETLQAPPIKELTNQVERLLANGDKQGALDFTAQQAAKFPYEYSVRLLNATLLTHLEKNQQALLELTAMTQDFPKQAKPFFMASVLHWQNGEQQLATQQMDQSLALDPSNLQGWLMLSQMHHDQEGHGLNVHKGSLQALIKASSFHPTNTDLLYRIATTYEEENKTDKAIEFWDKLLKIEPTNARAVSGKAINLLKLDPKANVAALLQTKTTDAKSAAYLLFASGVEALYAGNTQLAVDRLLDASEQLPNVGHIYVYLQQAYQQQNKTEKAKVAAVQGLKKGVYPAEAQTLTEALVEDVAKSVNFPVHAVSAKGVGAKIGEIRLSETAAGLVIKPSIRGLKPGAHGFHVHEIGSCDSSMVAGKAVAAGEAAGHYHNHAHHHAHGDSHGDSHEAAGKPSGDLADLIVDAKQQAEQAILAPQLTLQEVKGRAFMIHALAEDDASKRIACGIAAP